MFRRKIALVAVLGVVVLSIRPSPPRRRTRTGRSSRRSSRRSGRSRRKMQKQLEKLQRDLAARPTPTPTPTPSPTPAAAETRKIGPVTSPGLTPYPVATWGETGQVTSGTSFNPAISVITEGLFFTDDQKGGALGFYSQADGFTGTGVGGIPELSKGFNLGETEFAFSAAVDPLFDALAILTVEPGEVGIEEAWIRTRSSSPPRPLDQGRPVLQRHRLREQAAPAPVGLRRPESPLLDAPRRRDQRGRGSGRLPPEDSFLPSDRRGSAAGDESGRGELPRAGREPRPLLEVRPATLHRLPQGLARRRLFRRPPARRLRRIRHPLPGPDRRRGEPGDELVRRLRRRSSSTTTRAPSARGT